MMRIDSPLLKAGLAAAILLAADPEWISSHSAVAGRLGRAPAARDG